MDTHEKNGLTWTEIFVVMMILGIVSAVAVPRFSRASNQARLNDLIGDLQEIRSQLELFKIQHDDRLPGQTARDGGIDARLFEQELTEKGSDGLGPYLREIPANPYNNQTTVTFVNDPLVQPTGFEGTGWWCNAATGEFRACDSRDNIRY